MECSLNWDRAAGEGVCELDTRVWRGKIFRPGWAVPRSRVIPRNSSEVVSVSFPFRRSFSRDATDALTRHPPCPAGLAAQATAPARKQVQPVSTYLFNSRT